jgi:hypothetical protein
MVTRVQGTVSLVRPGQLQRSSEDDHDRDHDNDRDHDKTYNPIAEVALAAAI